MKALQELPIYLMNDQPTVGPKCGLRTILIGNFFHANFNSAINQCTQDGYTFIEEVKEDLE